jgi:hypothetical protein
MLSGVQALCLITAIERLLQTEALGRESLFIALPESHAIYA